MSFETLLPCPFCGGEPEEDAGGCIEYHGHEHQDYSITCKQCGAEVYCSVGAFEKADVPCSCHHDTRKVCVDKWNKRSATLQAQSDDGGEPADDERIMAIEGIHNCERCGDEGWVVGEMGITRCACGHAGNSPVIPEGYVMVPKEPTKEMIDAGWQYFWDTKNPSSKGTYKAMLAAAPQEVPDGQR